MAFDFEPTVMIWHRGKLDVALNIVKQLSGLYKDTGIGDKLDEALVQINGAEAELIQMTEKKNQDLFEQYQKEIGGQ